MLFHLLLYASFSLKQTQFLNLAQYLLTYWLVLATVYLHFYFLILSLSYGFSSLSNASTPFLTLKRLGESS